MIERILDAMSRTRWPLLLIGLLVMVIASEMFQAGDDESDARALMLGVGAILLGAGLVRLVYGDRARRDPDAGVPEPEPQWDDTDDTDRGA